MSSRRYMVAAMPFEHVNGKLANTAVTCPNSAGGGAAVSGGFAYGYRRHYSLQSRFGVRVMCRSLNDHPYTAAELAHKSLFSTSARVVKAALNAPAKRAAIEADFSRQSRLATLRGYAISRVMSNSGVLPQEWNV